MKHVRLIFLSGSALLLTSCLNAAWPRLGMTATAVFPNTGSSAVGFSVTVGSTTPVLVYEGVDEDREIFFQNTDATYSVHCGTYSTVAAASPNPRWIIRAGQDVTSNGTYNVYCVAESDAGASTVEITGNVEFDHKDRGR